VVFYPVNTFLNRKEKAGVGKVVETELVLSRFSFSILLYIFSIDQLTVTKLV